MAAQQPHSPNQFKASFQRRTGVQVRAHLGPTGGLPLLRPGHRVASLCGGVAPRIVSSAVTFTRPKARARPKTRNAVGVQVYVWLWK